MPVSPCTVPGAPCGLQAAIAGLTSEIPRLLQVSSPVAVIKSSDSNLAEKGLILSNSSLKESIMGKAWWQESPATVTLLGSREQRMLGLGAHFVLFIQSGNAVHGMAQSGSFQLN